MVVEIIRALSNHFSTLLALLVPQSEITPEADALDGDISAGLLEPEREVAEFVGEPPGLGFVIGSGGAILARAQHEESGRSFMVEHAEFELTYASRKICCAARDNHVPALEPRHQADDSGDRLSVIDVVEDHQPSRMDIKPPYRGLDLHGVLPRLPFGNVENVRTGRSAARPAFNVTGSSAGTNSSAE